MFRFLCTEITQQVVADRPQHTVSGLWPHKICGWPSQILVAGPEGQQNIAGLEMLPQLTGYACLLAWVTIGKTQRRSNILLHLDVT